MPNLAQFKNTSPASGQIKVLYRTINGVNTIKAITVSNVSKGGENIELSLGELQSIQFAVSASGHSPILEVEAGSKKPNYYYFNTTDIGVGAVSSSDDSSVLIAPYLLQRFKNNDYNALISNASISRASKFKFQVDRLEGNTIEVNGNIPVRPTNYESIISGSALLADVTDSNYTHTGHTNARYEGTVTSGDDFGGIDPAIAGKPFEAATYLSSSIDNFICSQSLSDRDIETFLFTGITDTPVSASRVFQIEENRVIPLTNRKIWVKDNRNILTVNDTGFITGTATQCSI